MNIQKSVILTLMTCLFLTSPVVMAEGKKLSEKLSGKAVVMTADIEGCDTDLKKFCPGLDPNSQNAFMCMMAYEEKLSDACKLGIVEAAMALKMGAAAIDYSVRACEADADKFCLDVKPGEGRLIKCIKKNETKVSKACTTALKETGLWEAGAK